MAGQRSPSELIDERIQELGDWRGDGNTRRAVDIFEDDKLDEQAFAGLVRATVELNES